MDGTCGRTHADELPLVILGGSDRRESDLPSGTRHHPLAAYKGAALEIAGRPVIAHLVERARASASFSEVLVAGPHRIYAPLVPGASVLDTDADVASNLRTALAAVSRSCGSGPVALMACDVLPSPEELREAVAEYRRRAPCGVWFPLIRVPEDPGRLGAFGWKPAYGIRPAPGSPPVQMLPGHLGVVDPAALRLELLYRLLGTAYRTRNRRVSTKRSAMLRATLRDLLIQDLRHLLALRLPDLTWTVVRNGLGLARDLRAGRLTLATLERRLGRIFLTARHRRHHPERGVVLAALDTLSLAEDIDTEEEADALGARLDLSDPGY